MLLLGGPNSFIRGMREAWQANIPLMWKERKVEIPAGTKPEELIKVPENAQYFAALGAVEFGKDEEPEVGRYLGIEKLLYYIDYGRAEEKAISGGKGLVTGDSELEQFKAEFRRKKFILAATFLPGQTDFGLYWYRWRLHLHQGRLARQKRRHPLQDLSAFQWQSHPGWD